MKAPLALASCLLFLAGCSTETRFLGLPIAGALDPAVRQETAERRGAVELYVKTNHPALVRDLQAGGGPALSEGFRIAGVPRQDQPARIVQLQSQIDVHRTNPGALVTALTSYGV